MSAEELVDIVDENNTVIDTITRKEMRLKKLPHRASYIACCDRQGRFVVEVRTLSKDYAPGLLDACVGGVIQHGEDLSLAAKRELLEEIGIDADKESTDFYSLGLMKIMWADGQHFFYGYLYLAITDSITVRQQSEVSGIMYLNKTELMKLKDVCARDSVVAFEEIIKRAQDSNYLPSAVS